jgi:hypothetical protein
MSYNFEDKENAKNAGSNSSRKGVPNKSTQHIRDSFQSFVEGNQENFEEWIARVAESNPAKAIELVVSLSEFILPKLSRTEVKAEVDLKTRRIGYDKEPNE